LPHHGSRHAESESYLERIRPSVIRPSVAFVSSGHGNPYGFPHQEVIEACNSRHIPLFRTDLDGMLTFHIDNGRWLAQTGRALQLTHFK
jgi:competence protein ComEC